MSSSVNDRKPLWPVGSLAILTSLNLLDYLDRKLLDGVLPLLRKDLGLNYEQGGTLTTAFMLGYFVTAIVMAFLQRLEPQWNVGHLLFGTMSAASFFFPGLRYYRQRKRGKIDSGE